MKSKIENRIRELENELRQLKSKANAATHDPTTVMVPEEITDLFAAIEMKIRDYFNDVNFDPNSGEITIHGQRYVLFRSDSLSYEFLDLIKERYSNRPEQEAVSIGNNFLYDNAKVIGKKDAIAFHKSLGLEEPIEKLSAGPIHFAFTGWANVEIFDESSPTPDENYFLTFQHHNSFEAQSWIKAGKKSDIPVCTMNCGYSAGWCEESFDMPLTTVEITCEAKGDDACTFIMAPSDRIEQYVGERVDLTEVEKFEIPVFFKRKNIEEQLRESLRQKEMLIREIHHRVKNNLQVISSLLRLQMDTIDNQKFKEEFEASINRVNTMAVVHELMYQREDFDKVNLSSYLNELTKSLVQLYALNNDIKIDIEVDVENVQVNLEQSIPLSLVLNEITCNSFKHALHEGDGEFYIRLKQEDDKFHLVIGDTGPGITHQQESTGLGLALINILCEQLNAEIAINNSEKGLEYQITFELED